ncbi:hypothetical protein BsWGS_16959 [Bradybaena similaris]
MACFGWFSNDDDEGGHVCVGTEPSFDLYFNSPYVYCLNETTFKPFLDTKDVALVLFYKPGQIDNKYCKAQFRKAAKTTQRANHAFAAVNCWQEQHLCKSQDAFVYPYYRMYSRGRRIGYNDTPRTFTHKEMKKWLESVNVYDEKGVKVPN